MSLVTPGIQSVSSLSRLLFLRRLWVYTTASTVHAVKVRARSRRTTRLVDSAATPPSLRTADGLLGTVATG